MPSTTISQHNREIYLNRIEKAVRFMADHLGEEVNLELAAREAGFSPFHFHRLFTGITGETPQNCLTRLRMERAANVLVKSPSLSITEIAFACGYSSASAFARTFKRYFGIPAGEYARMNLGVKGPVAWVNSNNRSVENTGTILPEIQVRSMPALHLACFRSYAGYTPEGIKSSWERMFQWAQGRKLLNLETRLIAIAYDDPEITAMNRCRYYACITIPEAVKHDTRSGILDLPEHLAAVCRCDCDGTEIMSYYRAIYRDWLPQSDYLIADLPPYEIYYNAPENDPASKYVFDLCIPVQSL